MLHVLLTRSRQQGTFSSSDRAGTQAGPSPRWVCCVCPSAPVALDAAAAEHAGVHLSQQPLLLVAAAELAQPGREPRRGEERAEECRAQHGIINSPCLRTVRGLHEMTQPGPHCTAGTPNSCPELAAQACQPGGAPREVGFVGVQPKGLAVAPHVRGGVHRAHDGCRRGQGRGRDERLIWE